MLRGTEASDNGHLAVGRGVGSAGGFMRENLGFATGRCGRVLQGS